MLTLAITMGNERASFSVGNANGTEASPIHRNGEVVLELLLSFNQRRLLAQKLIELLT